MRIHVRGSPLSPNADRTPEIRNNSSARSILTHLPSVCVTDTPAQYHIIDRWPPSCFEEIKCARGFRTHWRSVLASTDANQTDIFLLHFAQFSVRVFDFSSVCAVFFLLFFHSVFFSAHMGAKHKYASHKHTFFAAVAIAVIALRDPSHPCAMSVCVCACVYGAFRAARCRHIKRI